MTVDGVEHVVERVTDAERIAAIRSTSAGDDVLIADGHHRYSVARTFRDECAARTGRRDTPAEATLAFVGELVAEQLSVEAIHRLYSGVSFERLLAALAEHFELAPAAPPAPATLAEMVDQGRLVLVAPDGSAEWLTRPGAFDGIRALDGAWLEHAVAGSGADVDYQHGLDEVARRSSDGRATAAVLIRPVDIAEIERTAARAC